MKKMAEEENQSSSAPTIKLNWEIFLFIDNHIEYSEKNRPAISKPGMPAEFYYKENSFTSDVFHPPLF